MQLLHGFIRLERNNLANTGKARAYTNIALIKYWGKKDDDLILPMNSSLSLTLDAFYTETTVHFDATLKEDQFYLNQQQMEYFF